VPLIETVRAATRHLTPTALVVVGKADVVRPLLAKLDLKIADPVAYTEAVSPTERRLTAEAEEVVALGAEEEANGRKLLAAALAAKGGAALSQVKDLVMRGSGSRSVRGTTQPIRVDAFQLPGKAARQDITVGPGTVVQVFVDGKGFVKEAGKVTELPASAATMLKRGLFRDPNFILLHAGDQGAKVRARPSLTEQGTAYDVLEVIAPDGDAIRLLLDPKTHLIRRMVYRDADKEVREELSDYRQENGIAFPRRYNHVEKDERIDLLFDRIEINKGLPVDVFSR
jgi:hypothetical protein